MLFFGRRYNFNPQWLANVPFLRLSQVECLNVHEMFVYVLLYFCIYHSRVLIRCQKDWCSGSVVPEEDPPYHRVSNWEVRRITEQPLLTSIIQKRRLMLFGRLIRMDESADARRILTAVPQSDWRRPVGRPHSSWMATLKNGLSLHNLTYEDAIEMALHKPQVELRTDGACRIMMMMMMS